MKKRFLILSKFFSILTFIVFITSNAFAVKFSHSPGDVVENVVFFGKRIAFPLPPGKFRVALVKKSDDYRDVALYQVDENTGSTRWAVILTATGTTQWEWWNPSKWCDRTNVYFIKVKKANKKFACWMVNHTRSDITANSGFWKEVRDYEITNNIKNPDIFVYTQHAYAKGSKYFGSSYFYNPELDGIPKPKHLEWATNEFHMQRVADYPKHKEFLDKFVSISASLIDQFNQLNQVKKSLTLNASNFITQVSINTEEKKVIKKKDSKNIVEKLKELKELRDSGAITKEEFEKLKEKIIN